MQTLSRRGATRKKVYDYPVNSLLSNEIIEADPPSYIKKSKFICLYVVPFEQETAHTSVSSYCIEYEHYFEQSQHLLMHVDLIDAVARFRTAKRLVFEGIDSKH